MFKDCSAQRQKNLLGQQVKSDVRETPAPIGQDSTLNIKSRKTETVCTTSAGATREGAAESNLTASTEATVGFNSATALCDKARDDAPVPTAREP